jgi:hypothetical protein
MPDVTVNCPEHKIKLDGKKVTVGMKFENSLDAAVVFAKIIKELDRGCARIAIYPDQKV